MKIRIDKIYFLLFIGIVVHISLLFGQSGQPLYYNFPSRLITGDPISYAPFNSMPLNLQEGFVGATAGNEYSNDYSDEGAALDLAFGYFTSMVYAPDGTLYFCDAMYSGIRKMSPSGDITVFVDGATLQGYPYKMVMDSQGNIYYSDWSGCVIRKITPSGVISVFAGAQGAYGYANGSGSTARFASPGGIAIDAFDNIYVIDNGNKRIRKITSEGVVSTLAGNGNTGVVNGTGGSASFRDCYDLDTDSRGNIYVTEYSDHIIRKITPWGKVTTYATGFYYPSRLTVNKSNGDIYVAESPATIKKVTPSINISTVIGSASSWQKEGLNSQVGYEYVDIVLWRPDGGLLIANSDGVAMGFLHTCRNDRYSISPGLPPGLTFDAVYGVISGSPSMPVTQATYTVKAYHFVGQPTAAISFSVEYPRPLISYTIPAVLAKDEAVNFYPTNRGGDVYTEPYVKSVAGNKYQTDPGIEGDAFDVGFGNVFASLYAPDGNIYIFDDLYNGIRKLSPGGQVTRFVGGSTAGGVIDGVQEGASFNDIGGMTMDSQGNLYVSERFNHIIRKITPFGEVTTLAGLLNTSGYSDGVGGVARFSYPGRMTIDGNDNIYVVDGGNKRIRKISTTGIVSTLAGNGSNAVIDGPDISASFGTPSGIDTDSQGNIYVSESSAGVIRKITPAGYVTTYIGVAGQSIHVDGTGANARFYYPQDIAVDKTNDDLYVIQGGNYVIRKVTTSLEATTISGGGNIFIADGPALDVWYEYPTGLSWSPIGGLLIADVYSDQTGWLRRYEKGGGYSITTTLPAGLSIDVNGVISGTPSEFTTLTDYEITARNNFGQDIALVSFSTESIASSVFSPSQDQNYVIETVLRKGSVMTTSQLNNLSSSAASRTIQYFDGLGRSKQSVQWQASSAKRDIVQHIEYDGFGRESRKYLLYVDSETEGKYRGGGSANVIQFYTKTTGVDIEGIARTSKPYSETVFENSPLNRVLEQGAPGEAWQPATSRGTTGRTVVTEYGVNTDNEVRLWQVNSANTGATGIGYYAAGKLYKIVIKDENWENTSTDPEPPSKSGTVEEFKDFEDRVILKRVWKSETEALDTYYIYDDFGDLRYVVPPAVTDASFTTLPSDVNFEKYIYGYNYDERRRLVEKKIPGKGWEHIVYNRNDQPVLTQDSVQRVGGKWNYTKYDAFGRITETGLFTRNLSRKELQDTLSAETANGTSIALWESRPYNVPSYDNRSYPRVGSAKTVLQINYYDDYGFTGASTLGYSNGSVLKTDNVTTLLTGVSLSKDDGTSPLLTVNYYDQRARLIQSVSQNHLGGTDRITNTYSFVGELLTNKREHTSSPTSSVTTILTSNAYDHVGRLVQTKKKINTTPEVIQSKLSYNEIGQLKQRDLHVNEGTAAQEIVYAYNERGWLKSINDPSSVSSSRRFGMQLHYANKSDAYNGNIGAVNWNTKVSDMQVQTDVQQYIYSYDKLNRLTLATYSDFSAAKDGFYDETLVYDAMGNISSLKRTNGSVGLYNDFSYSYTGNQLSSVADAGLAARNNSFTYNANGSAISNTRLGITNIEYNYLNLPKKLVKGTEQLLYSYDATGKKLSKQFGTSVTQYLDGIQYKDGALEFIQTEEGRILPNGSSFIYEYFLKDHLGNTRAVVDHTGALKQITDYYAFGMEMNRGNALNATSNQYKYNGKELQVELGLDQLDYGARFYDAEIGRWNVVDPMAEQMRRYSPYVYGNNNPIRFIDPDGMLSKDFLRELWDKSENGSTWTNQGDGAFSDGNDQIVKEQDPPEKKSQQQPFHATGLHERANNFSYDKALGLLKDGNLWEYFLYVNDNTVPAFTPVGSNLFNLSFTINASKFRYFFGKVASGSAHNVARSAQNLKDLTTLGIKTESELMMLFEKAIKTGVTVSTKTTQYGTTVMRSVEVGGKGEIVVGFFYEGGKMVAKPSVSTIIPKIFK